MASVYYRQGRYEEALEHFARALAIARAALGENHPRVGATLKNMAHVYYRQRRYGDAAIKYDEAARVYGVAYGDAHQKTLDARNHADEARARASL